MIVVGHLDIVQPSSTRGWLAIAKATIVGLQHNHFVYGFNGRHNIMISNFWHFFVPIYTRSLSTLSLSHLRSVLLLEQLGNRVESGLMLELSLYR
jgi:hypothetical protein